LVQGVDHRNGGKSEERERKKRLNGMTSEQEGKVSSDSASGRGEVRYVE